MRSSLRTVMCVVCAIAGLAGWTASVSADVSLAEGDAPVSGAESPLSSSPLVIVGSPEEAQQLQAEQESRSASPEVAQAREESGTAYSGLGRQESKELLSRTFPSVVDEPDGGMPRLPEGVKITALLSDDTASLELRDGKHGALAAKEPIARDTSSGRVPVDLSLSEDSSGFEPKTPATGENVHIGKRLGEGVSIPGLGVSLTPVDEQGAVLEGSPGEIDGAGVFYGDSEDPQAGVVDMDTLIKPSYGFSVETVLRSQRSTHMLFFRVGLPEGASLVETQGGGANVVDAGNVLARIAPPSGVDAEGTFVPVSMSVSGDVLSLAVAHQLGEYKYPIVIDPTVIDEYIYASEYSSDNWTDSTNNPADFVLYGGYGDLDLEINPYFVKGQYAYFVYPTQKESHIYEWKITTNDALTTKELQGILSLAGPGGGKEGNEVSLPASGNALLSTVCAVASTCEAGTVTAANKENRAFLEVHAIENSSCCTYSKVESKQASVYILQEKAPTGKMDTTDATVNGIVNPLYANTWAGPKSYLWMNAFDPGLGVSEMKVKSSSAPGWAGAWVAGKCAGVQCDECYEKECSTGAKGEPGQLLLGSGLVDGEDWIEGSILDPAGLKGYAPTVKIKYDGTAPVITSSGLPGSHEIGEGAYQFKASATDGSGTTASSGVASIALKIDGGEVSRTLGSCAPGPCTAKNEWTIRGSEYAAGLHNLLVLATDNVGNVSTENLTVIVHHASPVTVGPGSVDPVSGEFSLDSTDVSMAAPGAGLSVSRAHNSQHLAAGQLGPLGRQWTMSLSGHASLTLNAEYNMVLTEASGAQVVFTVASGGKFVSPPGDANLVLKGVSGGYLVSNASTGSSTTFKQQGGLGAMWVPTIQEGPASTETVTFAYRTAEVESHTIIEPLEALAPVPSGVSCAPTLNRGCRALTFNYATSTTATGESPSEWGDYTGRLTRVYFTAWNPATKAMATSTVAQYSYDKQGRLRAEWDPRLSTPLKTTYGYDSEGRVTAVSSAGQQPWLLNYGTIAGNGEPRALLSVIRPSANTTLGSSPAPQNTAVPTLSSTTPVVGTKISVSGNGTWSNSPLYYGYQWDDCNSSGGECTPIAGAVNRSYYPAVSDEKRTLLVQVRALNVDGATLASSAATGLVSAGTPNSPAPEPPSLGSSALWTVDYHVPVSGTGSPHNLSGSEVTKWAQKDFPEGATAIFPPDEPEGWPAQDYKRATVYYLDAAERTVDVATPGGGISTTEYNSKNDVVRTLSADDRAAALIEGAKASELAKLLDTQSMYNEEGTELLESLGPTHTVKLSSGNEVLARAHTIYHYDEGAPAEGGPYRLVTKLTQGAVYSGTESDVRTTTTLYAGGENAGWEFRKPTSTVVDPGGIHLTHSTVYDPTTGNVVETSPPGVFFSPTYLLQFGSNGTGNGQFKTPGGVTVDTKGHEWVVDTFNNRVQEFSSKGEYIRQFGSIGTGNGLFKDPYGITTDSKGDVWVADSGNDRVQEFSPEGAYMRQFGTAGKESGQLASPWGVAIDPEGHVWIGDSGNDRVQEFSSEGAYIRKFGLAGTGNGQFKELGNMSIAIDPSGHIWVTDVLNNRVQKFTATGEYLAQYNVEEARAIASDAAGNMWIAQPSGIEKMSRSGVVLKTFGSTGTGNGQFKTPQGIALDPSGNVWVADTGNNRIQELAPSDPYAATATQVIYYSSAANASYPECGEHPEWANLPCRTQPAAQPNTSGLPNLPVTTVTYNMYDEPEKTAETVTKGAEKATRTKTTEYEAAGRVTATLTLSTVDTALPSVTYEYNLTTGALLTQSTITGGKTQSVTSVLNSLGQLTSYVDADGNTSAYGYDIDGRPSKTSDGKGTQTYTYDLTTGLPTALEDSAAETFTASYDLEGNLTSEGYPNAMSANYTYDATGKLDGVKYVKNAHCASTCPETWYSDSATPSIQGQWLSQTSSLASHNYTYDHAGRLTQAQDTPVGKGCITRIYAYDEETNRLSATTREPGIEGKCASEGGINETHAYDDANRLTDTGVGYDMFGDTTKLPASDAGGYALTSEFYSDDQVASQTQNEQTVGYELDPAGRTREVVSTGKIIATEINHYAGPGSSPAWTEEISGKWTRDISGIDGTLVAIQHNSETPVLQLFNLHGDVVATASESETVTAPTSTVKESTEYGIPATEAPQKYSWLGSHEIPTMLPSGVTAMGARSYIPQLGRFLQTDPVPGGSVNAYTYTYGDPVDSSDLTGDYTATIDGYDQQYVSEKTDAAVALREAEIRAAEEAAERAEAERKAAEAAAEAAQYAAIYAEMYGGEEWPEEEWWEEEGEEYEYVAYHNHGAGASRGAGRVEEGLLFQWPKESRPENPSGSGRADLGSLCQVELGNHGPSNQHGACERYVHWYSKVAKSVWHGVKRFVKTLTESYYNPDTSWSPSRVPWEEIFTSLPRMDYGVPPLE